MAQPKPQTPALNLSLDDVFFIVFKHKWFIALSTLVGLSAATALYVFYPSVYESQSKLLVRYVVDTSAIDQVESKATIGSASQSLINAEVEILTSWDLAVEVAEAVGVDRILPTSGGPVSPSDAAAAILAGLTATPISGTNMILVSYKNREPDLATLVLKDLVARYFAKHLDVHRSADAFDFVSRQSDQVRARLSQTEEELEALKGEVGIISLKESTTSLNAELAKARDELQAAETQYAEQKARIAKIEMSLETQKKTQQEAQLPGAGDVQLYQKVTAQLERLHQTHLDLLSRYTQTASGLAVPGVSPDPERSSWRRPLAGPEKLPYSDREMAHQAARERYRRQNDTGFSYQGSKKNFDELVKEAEQELMVQRSTKTQEDTASQSLLVKLNKEQIEHLESQRLELEKRFPRIATVVLNPSGMILDDSGEQPAAEQKLRSDLIGERGSLAGVEARVETLRRRIQELNHQARKLAQVGPRIEQLERAKEIEETNYKYFQASLEKARVDEALDPSKMPNISVIQSPSAALRTTRDLKKRVLGLASGGLAIGFAFAFIMELVFNRTVKRRFDLEVLLGIPPLLSIPYLNGRHRSRSLLPGRRGWNRVPLLRNNGHSAAPWDPEHWVRPYSEAIRDRLVLYFEINNMQHKPKLVAVTDCAAGGGASTLAGGLAAALSETGDGKVLLVDMNVGRPEIHPFSRGTPACSLTEALVGEVAPAGENLYLAVAASPNSPKRQLIPKKFHELMPHLKASNFDYIIFDMPPLGQTSITLPMSRFMDKVLLIVETEKSSRDFVRRAYAELLACGAKVSVVLNKARSYAPKGLGLEG